MKEKCCKCGKIAILDNSGKCFDCADVRGIKYVERTIKKKEVKEDKAKSPKRLWIIPVALDIIFVLWFFQQSGFEMLFRAGYVLAHACLVWQIGSKNKCNNLGGVHIIALILKMLLLLDMPMSIEQKELVIGGVFGKVALYCTQCIEITSIASILGYILLAMRPFLVYAVLGGVLYVSSIPFNLSKITNNNRKPSVYEVLDGLLDYEDSIQLERISEYRPLYSEISKREDKKDWLIEARGYVMNTDTSDEVKEKLIVMLQNEDSELWATNDVMIEYLKIVEECMLREIKKDENGNWVDEVGQSMSRDKFPFEFPSSIKLAQNQKYVTRKMFEIETRVSREINSTWDSFRFRYSNLNPTDWFASFKSNIIGLSLGDIGEKRVAQELAPYDDQMIILPNIRLEVEGESIESDFVVISPWGVHILEVKNLGSSGTFDLVIEKDGRWSQVRGHHRETMKSPVHQNERHIVYMEKLVNRELSRSIDDRIIIQGMVVLANNKVDIKNFSDNVIKRYDNIIGTIRSGEKVLKENEMKQIAEILKKYALPVKEYSAPNYFKLFFETKILVEEYKHWKSATKGLVRVAERYKNNILEPLQKNNY